MSKIDFILDVYETHSISKTATRLNYTQSAVSQAISNYEKEIGIALFKRSKAGMTPLPGTEKIFEELKNIQSSRAHIEQFAAKISGLEVGLIRIGTIQSIAYHWLPGILKKFTALYPKITFQLYVSSFQELNYKLQEGELDCIFTSEYAAQDLPNTTLGEDELMLVMPKHHPLSKKLMISFSDVMGQDFIMSADDTDYETGELFRMYRMEPNVQFYINEDYTVIKMVEQGFGIAILPNLLLYNIPFDVCVRSFTEHYKRKLVVARSSTVEASPALERFITFISTQH
ncbi:LysR family transcriptional regulator [Aedoeadaptatus pacaensis]|uniref:LysR family transcriptional regulator n=1 Tax=Aedoeadaptatus pacaensis TaxID=1776390 RepID=UPI00083889DB|nr:LysR family transcriptional regulator [Peptoniphilus pacaensis]